MSNLINAFQSGGIFMYPIAIFLVLATIIIAERLYMIIFVYSSNGAQLMQEVQRLILNNNIEDAIKLCNSKKNAALYNVFKTALVNSDADREELQEHVEIGMLSVIPRLQQRMPYLFTIANVATLVGLLGTIVGLVKTFEAVGAVEGTQKQMLLSAGISTAMNTTAFGLIVAIPCMLSYGYLFNKINNIIDDIEHYSAKLVMLLKTGRVYYDNFTTQEMVTTKQDLNVEQTDEAVAQRAEKTED